MPWTDRLVAISLTSSLSKHTSPLFTPGTYQRVSGRVSDRATILLGRSVARNLGNQQLRLLPASSFRRDVSVYATTIATIQGQAPRGSRTYPCPSGPCTRRGVSQMSAAKDSADVCDVPTIVRMIHDSPMQACIYATGGGMQALSWLLTASGASRTVLEARVPYAPRAMGSILGQSMGRWRGGPLKQVASTAASAQTAAALAGAAYHEAANLAAFGRPIVGIGCTCALATDRIKKGDHKVMMASRSQGGCITWEVILHKGSRSRSEEDSIASRLLVALLAEAADLAVPSSFHFGLDPVSEPVQVALEGLLQGSVRAVEFAGGQTTVDAPRRRRVYLPGSFNPLHDGHRKLLAAAVQAAGDDAEGCFEMSVGNPDKGLMDIEEVVHRVKPFQDSGTPLVVVQAPLFTDKANLFPEAVFVVGYDTAVRLVDERYYSSHDPMAVQFQRLAAAGCRFLVAGRVDDDGNYLTLSDIQVADTLQHMDLFEAIPEDTFRLDISSTQLRKQADS